MAGIDDLARVANLPIADLSGVEQTRGRLDWFASKALEMGIQKFAPGLVELHKLAKPIIDGQLVKHLSKTRLPFLQGD